MDARFIWTEPHCRRIILELELKKEIRNGFSVIVVLVISYHPGKGAYHLHPGHAPLRRVLQAGNGEQLGSHREHPSEGVVFFSLLT